MILEFCLRCRALNPLVVSGLSSSAPSAFYTRLVNRE